MIRTEPTQKAVAASQFNRPLKVAYIMSRFPKLTETFILNEILAMDAEALRVEIFPLIREKAEIIHPEAVPLVSRAQYTPFISGPIIHANLRALRQAPGGYLGTLARLVRETWGSRRFFFNGLALFPKAVYLASLFQEQQVQHIHAHFASHPAAAAFVIHRLSGIPFSFTAHGSDLHRDQHMLGVKVAEAAFVVTISEHNRQLILEYCGPEAEGKVQVVHCGIDLQRFRPQRRDEASPEQPFRVLSIGTMHEVKGQGYLLEALAQLRERGVDSVCDLVGDGPDQAALQQQAEQLGIAERVRFHGKRTRDQVIQHLQEADVFVAPSVPSSDGRREGIPVVLMEAMASGVPVVASRLSGIPELVEDKQTGLLVEPRDVIGLANALERLYYDHSERRQLAAAGREKVSAEFDLQQNAAALAQQFREVAR